MGSDIVSSYGILDVTLVPCGILLFALYHVWLVWRVQTNPLQTVVGINNVGKRAWVRAIMADQDRKNVLAVQTLRNSVMASSLFATTAIVLSSAIATIVTTRDIRQFAPVVLGSKNYELLWAKFITIFITFLWAFMCHIQSIRYLNHVSFLINIPLNSEPGITVDYIVSGLQRGGSWYTVGTRGFYLAFPLMLWLFGSIPMFASVLLLLPFLHYQDTSGVHDYAERRKEHERHGLLPHGAQHKGATVHSMQDLRRTSKETTVDVPENYAIPDID